MHADLNTQLTLVFDGNAPIGPSADSCQVQVAWLGGCGHDPHPKVCAN